MSTRLHCIRRKVTGVFLSVHANRDRPAIVAFRHANNAKGFNKVYYQFHNPKQEVVVNSFTEIELLSMFKNSHLDVAIIDEATTLTLLADPVACAEMMERTIRMP